MTNYLLNYTRWNRLNEQANTAYGNKLAVIDVKDLPAKLPADTPTKGYVSIAGGNLILAELRSTSLKSILMKQIPEIMENEISDANFTINQPLVGGADEKFQYVKGSIYANMIKKPKPEIPDPTYKWRIDYDWYQMGDSDDVYAILHSGNAKEAGAANQTQGGYSDKNDSRIAKFKSRVAELGDDVTVAAIQKQGRGAGSDMYTPNAWIKIDGWKSRKGNTIYFDNEDAWKKAVMKIDMYDNSMTGQGFRKQASQSGSIGTWNQIDKYVLRSARGFWEKGVTGSAKFPSGGAYGIHGMSEVIKHPTLKPGEIIDVKYDIHSERPKKAGEIADVESTNKANAAEGIKKEKIGEFSLTGAQFKANMIGLTTSGSEAVLTAMKSMMEDLIDKDYKPVDISVTIEGSASSIPATNRLPKGITEPDHDYKGKVPKDKWLIHP